jgi:hypothetical protein
MKEEYLDIGKRFYVIVEEMTLKRAKSTAKKIASMGYHSVLIFKPVGQMCEVFGADSK